MADGNLRLHVWHWARGDLTHARVAAVVVVDCSTEALYVRALPPTRHGVPMCSLVGGLSFYPPPLFGGVISLGGQSLGWTLRDNYRVVYNELTQDIVDTSYVVKGVIDTSSTPSCRENESCHILTIVECCISVYN